MDIQHVFIPDHFLFRVARKEDGSQPFSVLMNEQVSNPLPPKLTSQINAGAIWARVCSLLCELAVSELREISLKKFAVLLVQCDEVIK